MQQFSRRQFLLSGAAICAAGALGMTGCSGSSSSDGTTKLGVAYQYGLAYAPVVIAKEKGYIEEAYKNATGKELTVEWNQMSSGSDINTGITSGSIQVGFMGVAPAVTGISTGLNYRIFTNVSGQDCGLMTREDSITKLADIVGSKYQIALVNTGSIQHITLAMALVNSGLDAHALDSNIVAMKHPDGMSAMQSGNVACHLTTNPYIFKEREDAAFHELTEINKAWPKENSYILGVAATSLHDDANLYDAVCDGIQKAMDFISNNLEESASLLCQFDKNSADDELKYLKQGSYSAKTVKLSDFATFMADNGFLTKSIGSYSDLVYDNVVGD